MKIGSNESFDDYAAEYDSALSQGLSVLGENKDYFALRRIECLGDRVRNVIPRINHVMDYSCGTGSSAPLLVDILGAGGFLGTDTSRKSLDIFFIYLPKPFALAALDRAILRQPSSRRAVSGAVPETSRIFLECESNHFSCDHVSR